MLEDHFRRFKTLLEHILDLAVWNMTLKYTPQRDLGTRAAFSCASVVESRNECELCKPCVQLAFTIETGIT